MSGLPICYPALLGRFFAAHFPAALGLGRAAAR